MATSKRERKYGFKFNPDEPLTMAERGAYGLNNFVDPEDQKKPKKTKYRKRDRWFDQDD